MLFAVELDRRWTDESIRGYAVHPGVVVSTNLGRSMPEDEKRAMYLAMELIDESSRPIIDPAPPKPIAFGAEPVVESTVVPHALDPASAHRLWELSEQLIKAN
ncbi:hypothetical protein AB0H36_23850 [Kribbella sp. NPDC050820]|uniref:hypothetical protein n=1 Tax=Kribbella sp. NPDC050820 TaxID=3155408 RepID=UPI0033F51F4D